MLRRSQILSSCFRPRMDGCERCRPYTVPPIRRGRENRRHSVGVVWQELIPKGPCLSILLRRRTQPTGGHALQERLDQESSGGLRFSFRQRTKRVAVAMHDVFDLLHLLLKLGIVRCQAVIAVCRLNKKDLVSISRLQSIDYVLGQDNT